MMGRCRRWCPIISLTTGQGDFNLSLGVRVTNKDLVEGHAASRTLLQRVHDIPGSNEAPCE